MNLSEEFTLALEGTIETAKMHGYSPTIFMRMLAEHGGVQAAKQLLASDKPQSGLFELYHLGILNESMEAVVVQEKYRSLFTEDELTEARRRLEELDYSSEMNNGLFPYS